MRLVHGESERKMNADLTIGVMGAGSVGCYLGGLLAASGRAVRFVGRPRIEEEVRTHGLTITGPSDARTQLGPDRFLFSTDVSALDGADAVLVTVKSRDTEAAAIELARHLTRGDCVVISFQNGVRNVGILKERINGRKVLAGMVTFNVLHRSGGHFHRGTSGPVAIEAAGGVDVEIAEAFRAQGLEVFQSPRMDDVLWSKLVINMNNAVNALAGVPLRDELRNRRYRLVLAASIREALRVLRAAGIRPVPIGKLNTPLLPLALSMPDWIFNRIARAMANIDPQARSSMWEDLEQRRPTEIDYLTGEIVELAHSMGMRVPLNEAIVRLVKQAEAAGLGSPGLAPEQMRSGCSGGL